MVLIALLSIWRMRSADTPYSVAKSCSVAGSSSRSQRASMIRRLRSSSLASARESPVDRFFAVSGIVRGKTFYSRCNFAGPRGVMHCLYLDYPAAETRAWDGVVTRMSRSLRAASSSAAR